MFRTPLLAAIAVSTIATSAFAATITEWNFDASNTTPSIGAGTASLVGGTSATFAGGNGAGQAWNTSTYAAQSTGSGTRGVEFLVSTAGYENITLSYDHRSSGTASRWAQIQYTTNGGANWTVLQDNSGGLSPHDTFYSFTGIAFPASADEQAGFGVRILSIFSPQAFDQNASLADFSANTAYMRANAAASYTSGGGTATGDYGTSGTWRFDNVSISGTAVPEPATLSLLAIGALAGLRRRRA